MLSKPKTVKIQKNDGHQLIEQPETPNYYLKITASFFLVTVVLFCGLAFFSGKLTMALGDRAYYILLFPLAFSTAAFLFGVLHSWAVYKHKTLHGSLELGGPVVLACMVVIGGFKLHADTTFFYTVKINIDILSDISPSYPVLKGGELKILEGNKWENGNLNNDGDFDFKGLDGNYKNKKVKIKYTAKFYKATCDSIILTDGSSDLLIRPDGSLGKVTGVIKDSKGGPVQGAKVDCLGMKTETGSDGGFSITIPSDKQSLSYQINAYYGKRTGLGNVEPSTNKTLTIYLSD